MKFSKVFSAQSHALKAHIISVETDISRGLHSLSIVGLPDKAVEESRDRVSAAIKNSGFKSPKQTNTKTVISLAPADLKKEGPAFDLPIALGYLLAAGEIDFSPDKRLFVGELALDGRLQPVNGALSFAKLARDAGFEEIYVPQDNGSEAALIGGIKVYAAENLSRVIRHLCSPEKMEPVVAKPTDSIEMQRPAKGHSAFDEIAGQESAKRGLVIAAAGRHNVALFGPPGTGKTMLARALVHILPKLSFEESLEVTEIYSSAGHLENGIVLYPPVRSPHHTSSYTAIIGGGASPRMGEVTLAHRGVLFMDEFPEFDKRVIESLRQPLEDRFVSVSRGKASARFPADFILVAAMNPCPCGNKGIAGRDCRCAPAVIRNYEKKISGPIVDRIDMWLEVSKVEHDKLLKHSGESPETKRAISDVARAREIQSRRMLGLGIAAKTNSAVDARDLHRAAMLSPNAHDALNRGARAYGLSGRGYHRTVKLARTIADIAGSETIEAPHVLEALQYRQRIVSGP